MAYIQEKRKSGTILVKRVSLLCIFTLFFVISAKAQEQKIVLPKQTLSAKEAIVEIKNQTGYYFAISHTNFDDYRVIYFPKSTLTLREALDHIIAGTNLTFQIRNKQILILALDELSHETKKKPVEAASSIVPPQSPSISPTSKAPSFTNHKFEQDVMEYIAKISQVKDTPENIDYSFVEAEIENVKEEQLSPEIHKTYTYPSQEWPLTYIKNEIRHLHPEMLRSLPTIGVKVNVAYGAVALAPNIALEVGLSQRTSLDLSVACNPWKRDKAYETNKMAHLIAKAEFRYWLCERFNGHFFGIHPFYWDYNVSGKEIPLLFDKEYRYEGNAFGIGASYGYHWMWSKRWGMEINAGAGGSFMRYKKFKAEECGEKLGKFKKKYFGPTSAGIKIIFMIK